LLEHGPEEAQQVEKILAKVVALEIALFLQDLISPAKRSDISGIVQQVVETKRLQLLQALGQIGKW